LNKTEPDLSETEPSGFHNLKAFLEWDRLFDFFRINPRQTSLFIVLGILSDLSLLIAPALVILTVSQITQSQPDTGGIVGTLAPLLSPKFALPIAFVAIIISQLLLFWHLVIIRGLDRAFFKSESEAVLKRYKSVDLYRHETGNYVRRGWFGKNIARNVRHTSEAMQAQLKLVPDTITFLIVIGLLAATGWALGVSVIVALAITSALLVSQSSKIYALSKKHFSQSLPAFAASISQLLKKIYFIPREVPFEAEFDPSFQDFLDSRYRLYIQRGYFAAFSTIIISACLLTIIYLAILFGGSTVEGESRTDILLIQVVLLLQIMNKGRAILGGLGGIMTFYPQIKMARDIDESLTKSLDIETNRALHGKPRAIGRLPFLLKLTGNGRLTRFNFTYAVELIEREVCDDQIIPMEKTIRLSINTVDTHLKSLQMPDIPQNTPIIDTLVSEWRKQGKILFFIDWKLFSEMTYTDFEKFLKKHNRMKFVLATHSNIPPRWLKLMEDRYKEITWDDPTIVSQYGALEKELSGEDEDL